MPDALTLPPPYLDPSLYPDWQDVQRKQMLAQMLTGAMQQAGQTPESWNSMKVVPKRSPLQGLAQVLSGALAGGALRQANQGQRDYFTKLYAPQPASGSAPTPTPAPNDTDPAQAALNASGALPAAPQTQGTAPVTPAAASQPTRNPLIPSGMTPQEAQQRLNLLGPEKYASTYLIGTPEWQNALRANNGDVNAAMAQMRAKGTKEGAIDMRSGGSVAIPDQTAPGGYRMIRSPNLGAGQEAVYDGTGNVVGVRNIPGAVAAEAATKGATTAAEQANTPRMIPQGGGVERLGYPPTPPALAPNLSQTGAPPTPAAPAPPAALPASAATSRPSAAPGASTAAPGSAPRPANAWSNIPKLNIPNTPGQSSNDFQTAMLKGSAAKALELSAKYGSESDLADQKANYNAEALKALPAAEVGPLSHFFTENRAKLEEWGVPASMIPGSGTVTPTFELNKNLLNAALQGAKQTYGARMTGNEVMLQKNEASPSVSTSQAAIRSLIAQDNARNAYFKQRATDFGKFQEQGGDPNRFEGWYSTHFPLQSFAQRYATPAAAIQQLKQNPEQAPFFKQKYGWLPDGS